jgi:hypothetical protein
MKMDLLNFCMPLSNGARRSDAKGAAFWLGGAKRFFSHRLGFPLDN